MNPNTQQPQQQPMQFTDMHNDVYNQLRNNLLKYHAQGVPGIDKVLDSLNKQQTAMMQNYTPSQPAQPQQPTPTPQPPANDQTRLSQLSNVMQQIRQRTASTVPNGMQNYL